jgi:alkylation response protein AidB-like acyl-CoA dehydrogenase
MDFLPSTEQRDLQRGVRELLDDRFPLASLAGGFDQQLWDALDATGVFALRSELGLGLADAALVFEELGRAAVPGPLVATLLAHGEAPGPVTLLESSRPPLLVAHLDRARWVLVVDGDRAVLAEASALVATPVDAPVDPLTPLHEVTDVPTGRDVPGAATMRSEGAVLTAALQVGLAARLTELAVDHAKTRVQFDRPVGSFQAVKHICADMLVRAELARAAVLAAAVTYDDSDGDVEASARAVAGAKLLADEAATTNGRASVQVHGGMGFTWEVPVHFLLKRAWLHATEFGSADEHAEDLALRA